MADNDRKRRFRSTLDRSSGAHPGSLFYDPDTSAPTSAHAAPRRRPDAQATQDVIDVAAFIGKVETERRRGRPTPTPQPMQNVLGAFRGSPAAQTTIQILAAAATAWHFGPQSANARKWEKLAQDNAGRLEAAKAQQYRQERARSEVETAAGQVQQRTTERAQGDAENDRRVFDAAAALALSYVAVKSLPPFDKLAELSHEHVTAAVDNPTSTDVLESKVAATHGEQGRETEVRGGVDLGKDAVDTEPPPSTESIENADVSGELEQVVQPSQKNGTDLNKIGSALHSAGRGLATAVGPVQGDDEVAPPLSPVDMSQLSQELLDALGAAMSGHPRSVTEMLNIEREPDRSNETAFIPGTAIERAQEATTGY